jgi:hypothetical protein
MQRCVIHGLKASEKPQQTHLISEGKHFLHNRVQACVRANSHSVSNSRAPNSDTRPKVIFV